MLLLYHDGMRDVTRFDADVLAHLDSILFPENALNETTLANEAQHGLGWVIEVAGDVVAYALVRNSHNVMDLLRLGVHPDYQRVGFGTQLLQRLLQENEKAMLTVKKDNPRAIRLYRKHGFQIVGHLPSNNSWVMLREATVQASS